MTKFVIDASAWIEYLGGSESGKKAASILESTAHESYTSSATTSEVISKFLREKQDAAIALTAMNNLSTVIPLSPEMGSIAGTIHYKAKKKNRHFGMLDAFVVATARTLKAKILTKDKDFNQFKEAVFLEK